ncbi:thioredoxin family protein [Thalassotalea agarivorans]|uniref:Thioredoxin n=1 Tax=Thalassotalea agarivorans TaxID=349064 RepID=A0A1H9ZF24_THASX|nr:thioredoxin family protein [Thalassotalea agarivorans]SES80254.1 hypothetical protein SAMN05660429_00427 [Thalassotalea agarivorans]
MLRNAIVIICLAVLTACASTSGSDIHIGDISKRTLIADYPKFSATYVDKRLTDKQTVQLFSWPEGLRIDVFFGTWCHDSQREVPKFLKAIEKRPIVAYQLIGLDYNKTEPTGRAAAANVKFTPTFVVYVNNEEIGRIVERTNKGFIEDITAMVKQHEKENS